MLAGAAAEHRERVPFGLGHALRLVAVVGQAQVEDLGARRGRPDGGVGVEADEQVGLVVVGDRRTLVEPDGLVAVPGEDDERPQPGLDGGLQAAGRDERDVFFLHALGAARAVLVAAVPGIDHDRPDSARRRQAEQRRRVCRRCGRWRRGSLGPGRRGEDVQRNPARAALAGRIGGSERDEARTEIHHDDRAGLGRADALDQVRRGGRGQGGVECFRLEADQHPSGFLGHGVRRGRPDVEGDPGVAVQRLPRGR